MRMGVMLELSRLSRLRVLLLVLGISFGCASVTQAVVINEFMASNAKTLADPQGDYDDWIELYNPTETPVDIAGWYLTDDISEPVLWQVPLNQPDQTTIPPQGYLVIWADKDTGDDGLHAGFALSSSGEEVGLYASDGHTLMDVVVFPPQLADQSWGRTPDGGPDWRAMTEPSPGSANSIAYEGDVAPVSFSVTRGFYDEPISVVLETETPDANILYTLDGSDPLSRVSGQPARGGDRRGGSGTSSTGNLGDLYQGALTIDKTTCLRAVAVREGWRSTAVVTHTYLFLADIKRQSTGGQPPASGWPSSSVNGQRIDYGMDPDIVNDPQYADQMDAALTAIPTVSLVTDLAHLFHASTGIYTHARSEGRSWERPVSAELIHPDGSKGFQTNAGVRIRGGFSRTPNNPKHAFRLFFRSEYGAAKLTYPLFGDEGVDEFDCVDLRTSQNYSWAFQGNRHNTMVREVFSRDVQRDMGHPYTRSRYYHLYLNGQYWGLYQTQERSEASYAASYFGGDKDDYDVVKINRTSGRTMMATDGDMKAYRQLYEMARLGFTDPATYLRAQGLDPNGQPHPDYPKLLDVENLIDFMLIEYLTGDRDGPGSRYGNIPNNIFGIFNRVNPDGFKWFQHDSEHSLGTGQNNLVEPFSTAGSQWQYFNPHWLHERLMLTSEAYHQRFIDRLHVHFYNGGSLSPEINQTRIEARAAEIELAIIAESARWGDAQRGQPFTYEDWRVEVDWILDSYLPTRTDIVAGQFQVVDWYPTVEAPVFLVNDEYQHGGYVSPGALLDIVTPEKRGTVYYSLDGTDPRVGERPETTLSTVLDFNAPKRVWVPDGPLDTAWRDVNGFDDSPWLAGEGHVGFDLAWNSDFELGIDLETLMWAQSSSCFVRIPFDLPETLPSYSSLRLLVWFDDGFVAYINGERVAAMHAPENPSWSDHATQAHEVGAAPVAFDITSVQSLLRPGHNVLALQGFNSSVTSPDFLISAAIQAADTELSDVLEFLSPIPLERSQQVLARTWLEGQWSALTEAVFAVDGHFDGLRLTELMYHPAEQPLGGGPDSEYVELFNAGDGDIHLGNAAFVQGIRFEFPDVTLAPGAYALVVSDPNRFVTTYGEGLPIIGVYDGQLSNRGERLVLADPLGNTLIDITYSDGSHPQDFDGLNDPWPIEADGLGLALGLISTDTKGTFFSDWRSVPPTPGQAGSP